VPRPRAALPYPHKSLENSIIPCFVARGTFAAAANRTGEENGQGETQEDFNQRGEQSVGEGVAQRDQADILTIDLEGNVVVGTARRHSEVYIHSEIFKVRPDVNSVIHTHPTYATALSATTRSLKTYSQPGALFYEALGDYADTINLIRSHAMGAGVARALGAGRGVLLKNHGIVVTGATIEEAVIGTIMLENGAMVQLLAEAAGNLAPEFPRDDIEKLKHDISRPEQFVVNFDYLARRVNRGEK
jgi:L-fuculose-phosphate aldolase